MKHYGEANVIWNENASKEQIQYAKNTAKHKAAYLLMNYIELNKQYSLITRERTESYKQHCIEETKYTIEVTIWEL